MFKTCPNCGETLGERADSCYKCRYDFVLGRIPNTADTKAMEDEKRVAEELKKRKVQEERKAKLAAIEAEKNVKLAVIEAEKNAKLAILQLNDIYEYKVESVMDTSNGSVSVSELSNVITRYATQGWRLHTAITNEIGKNSHTSGIGGFTDGTNATIDMTVLIFERRIKKQND